jgi:inosine triphosphate pyrophosphatase
MSSEKISITLVTGNPNKAREFAEILGDNFNIINQKYDIQEIQGLPREVAYHKARSVADLLGKPVIIEDTCLYLAELPGLGAYVKFLEIGIDGTSSAENQCRNLYKIAKGCEDKTLIAMCIVTYCEPDGEPEMFIGEFRGVCCSLENGLPTNGSIYFGWDPIMFDPNTKKSFAQMTTDEKNAISHRARALTDFKIRFPKYISEMNEKKQKVVHSVVH